MGDLVKGRFVASNYTGVEVGCAAAGMCGIGTGVVLMLTGATPSKNYHVKARLISYSELALSVTPRDRQKVAYNSRFLITRDIIPIQLHSGPENSCLYSEVSYIGGCL